jgi:hypothetical protein
VDAAADGWGVPTRETVDGITRGSAAPADAGRLLELTRGHGGMANGRHAKRDVTWGAEASRIRRAGASPVLAALRHSRIQVRGSTAASWAAAVRTMSNCFNKARALLGLPQLE